MSDSTVKGCENGTFSQNINLLKQLATGFENYNWNWSLIVFLRLSPPTNVKFKSTLIVIEININTNFVQIVKWGTS